LVAWSESGQPVLVLVPEFDDYLRPPEAVGRFAPLTQAEVVGVPGAKHLWVGYAETVLDEIVKRVNPAAFPLPREWGGPMTYADMTMYADRTTAVFRPLPPPA
jgi:hypothetical protein